MTLNPKDDILSQVINAYEGYADTLSGEKRKSFQGMLQLCYQYTEAINARGEQFPEEAVIMTLLLKQHIMIEELKQTIAEKNERKGVQ